MDLNFENVSRAVPELGKAEVDLLLSHLTEDERLCSSTDYSIQMFARRLFPELYRWRASKAHEAIQEAVELLQRVDQILANVPDASDEVSRSQLEVRNNVVYLQREIGEQ